MPAPRFVTSAQFGAPGLYIQELTPSPLVRGIQRFTVGIAGECVKGPVNQGIEINSPARFVEVFGGRDYGSGGSIIGHIWRALLNKTFGKLVIVRAAASDAIAASFTAESAAGGAGTAIMRVDASSVGLWGNNVAFRVADASDGDANKFNLQVRYLGKVTTYENLSCQAGVDNLATVLGDDVANLVTLTKLADGRPVNHAAATDGADADGFVNLGEAVASFTSVAGSEGTIADADFTGANKAIDELAGYKGLGIAFVAGRSNTTIKAALLTKSAASNDRLFLVCPDASNTSLAAAITEVASLRDDRMVYCFNHPKTIDPETGETIAVEPTSWMAGILGQTDADVHPGDVDNKTFMAGIAGLSYESLADGDFDSMDEAGICGIERHHAGGFVFVSGVTTNGKPIDGRRTRDYIISGISARLEGSNKKPNTQRRRDADLGAVNGWLEGLSKQERFVAKRPDGKADISIRNGADVNTLTDWQSGKQKMVARIRTIPMNLIAHLEFEGGPAVTITQVTEG